MRTSYMPSREAEQVAWANNFFQTAGESPEAYGLTPAQIEGFGQLNQALKVAWAKVQDPATKTKVTVAAKNDALAAMKAEAAKLVSIVQGVGLSDAQKIALGVTVRDTTRTATRRPTKAPTVEIVNVEGRTVTVQLLQGEGRRGRPTKVDGATVFTHLGPTPPATIDGWRYASQATKTRVELPFGPSETGDTAWIAAFWTNAGGTGPTSRPVSVNLPAQAALPERAEAKPNGQKLKIAA